MRRIQKQLQWLHLLILDELGYVPFSKAGAEPSVRSLLIQMRFQGQVIATGTGFVAILSRGPVLITNRHNVTGRHQETEQPLSPTGSFPDEITIIHNRANRLGEWVERTESLFESDQPKWMEHPTLGKQAETDTICCLFFCHCSLFPRLRGVPRGLPRLCLYRLSASFSG